MLWSHGGLNDLWEVAYIGPMLPDPLVDNGLILTTGPVHRLSRVSQLSRVTR